MADTNLITVQGTYQGALSSSGPALFGQGNSVENSANIPVMVTGLDTSAQVDAPFSFVGGRTARAGASCSFIFNGVNNLDGDHTKTEYTTSSPYMGANMEGTASFNLNGGLAGMFIGDKSLRSHMESLSTFTANQITSVGVDNNVVHMTGDESISGMKTFTSSANFGDEGENRTTIGGGAVGFQTANEYEPSVTIGIGGSGNLNVDGDVTFNGGVAIGGTLSLNSGTSVDFTGGDVTVKTVASDGTGDNTAASTKYVHDAIRDTMTGGGVYDDNGVYTGVNTFANNVTLSSHKAGGTIDDKVEVDLTNGKTYVADASSSEYSSLVANCKFVKDTADSYYSRMCSGSSSVGSGVVPVYLNGTSSLNASLVQSESNVGSGLNPIYMFNGSLVGSSASKGGTYSPVYLGNGEIKECNPLVTTQTSQDVTGIKTFTNTTWQSGGLRVYSNIDKGSNNSVGVSEKISFISASLRNEYAASSMKIGQVSCDIGSSYNQTSISTFTNVAGSTNAYSIGVRVSPNGSLRQAFAVNPTDSNGNVYESSSESDTVLPTIGWANSHYARKDSSARFDGNVVFSKSIQVSSSLEIVGGQPSIDFKTGNGSSGYTARITQQNGSLRLIPCDELNAGTSADSATNILLGTQTIGLNNVASSICQPVYLNGGVISPITANVGASWGNSCKLMHLSNGSLMNSTTTIGGNGDVALMELTDGKLQKSSLSGGSSLRPLYLNNGYFQQTKEMLVASLSDTQNVYGRKFFRNGALFADGMNVCFSTPPVNFWLTTSLGMPAQPTGRIIQYGDYTIEFSPCDIYSSSIADITKNTAKRLRFGRASIGSSKVPVYLNGGIITQTQLTHLSPRLIGHIAKNGYCEGYVWLSDALLPGMTESASLHCSVRIALSNASSTAKWGEFEGLWGGSISANGSHVGIINYPSDTSKVKRWIKLIDSTVSCNITIYAYD